MTKDLKIRMQPNGRLYEVFFAGGGELPKELTGKYTSHRTAQADITAYLTQRSAKTKDGAGKKTSRAK